ncbi:MAG: flagellar basal-body rod protein FlgG [Gammaproteobacteria bacterium]|nr:flagellar basal-body rod protein FlgG [Gammaproteobacteria bacterium]
MRALWVAKTGLDAQQTRLAVVSNNLANVNTAGFKRDRAVFADLLYQEVRAPGAQTSENTQLPSGLSIGTGVRTLATEKQFTQGNLQQTEGQLDVAIQGQGFFEILMPDGTTAYTRDGAFQIDSNGQVVTATGYQLQPGLTVPVDTQQLTIGVDGTVSVTLAGNPAPTNIGNIQLVDFVNPAGLQARGGNLYVETAASGPPTANVPGTGGVGTLVQGALETSNVNVVEELVNMIETQRAYEINSKAIATADAMLQFVNNNL